MHHSAAVSHSAPGAVHRPRARPCVPVVYHVPRAHRCFKGGREKKPKMGSQPDLLTALAANYKHRAKRLRVDVIVYSTSFIRKLKPMALIDRNPLTPIYFLRFFFYHPPACFKGEKKKNREKKRKEKKMGPRARGTWHLLGVRMCDTLGSVR